MLFTFEVEHDKGILFLVIGNRLVDGKDEEIFQTQAVSSSVTRKPCSVSSTRILCWRLAGMPNAMGRLSVAPLYRVSSWSITTAFCQSGLALAARTVETVTTNMTASIFTLSHLRD